MPRNPPLRRSYTRGRNRRKPPRRTVPQKTDRRRLRSMVRVKRRGKSPPPAAQASGHGKPHRVQGQIGDPGAARSKAQAGSRVSAAQINDPLRRATGEDRTRLTALSRLHYFCRLRPDQSPGSQLSFGNLNLQPPTLNTQRRGAVYRAAFPDDHFRPFRYMEKVNIGNGP